MAAIRLAKSLLVGLSSAAEALLDASSVCRYVGWQRYKRLRDIFARATTMMAGTVLYPVLVAAR